MHVYSIFGEAVSSAETMAETYEAPQYHSHLDNSADLNCSETSDISLYHTKFVKIELKIN